MHDSAYTDTQVSVLLIHYFADIKVIIIMDDLTRKVSINTEQQIFFLDGKQKMV